MLSNQGKEVIPRELKELTAVSAEIDALRIDRQSIDLFMQAPVGMCLLQGVKFKITLANDTILTLWGKGKSVIGKTILDALPEIAGQGYVELLEEVLQTCEAVKFYESEVKLVRNGVEEMLYVNFLYQPYFENEGAASGVFVIATEVTETVVTRKKIEESETQLRNIIEQTPSPILILKGEELILEVANQPLFDLWNVDADAIGKPFLEILPEMRDQVFEKLLLNVYRTGETYFGYETPAVFLRKNGTKETVFVNFVYQPYRTKDNVITGVIVLASDVTGQVLAKQELVRSEARHRLAVEAAKIGTYEINLSTSSIIHNPRTAEIFGFSSTETVGYDTFINALFDDERQVRLKAHDILKETGELDYEARIVLPDNSVSWIRLNGKTFTNDNFVPIIIGTVLDVTEEKKAAELLEQKISDRTKELTEANDQLEKFNVELEQFTHVASHDLQEPLRKIKLYSNMVLSQGTENLEPTTKKHIIKINETAERMSTTLSALLNYTQLKKVEEFSAINLDTLIAGVLTDLEVVIAEKNAQVLFEKLPEIHGIPHQIQQLFYNLINNALKYSKTGVPPVILIKVSQILRTDSKIQTNANRAFWEFIVEDNGVGFDQKFSEKIFTMFQRLHTKQAYSGTGIGLSLCKRIVENHKGFIWATSVADEGARFYILLPVFNTGNFASR
jgi:PAS domain S-box-containing protein